MAGRRAKRVKPVRKIKAGFLGPGVHFTGELVDLSASGLLIRCSNNVEKGTVGRLGIEMGQDTIRILAEVQRVIPNVGVAFEFIRMRPRNRELILRLIMRVEKKPST